MEKLKAKWAELSTPTKVFVVMFVVAVVLGALTA